MWPQWLIRVAVWQKSNQYWKAIILQLKINKFLKSVVNKMVWGTICCFLQSLSHVRLFVTPWTAMWQASLSFTISQTFLKCMSIESIMPSKYLILYRPLLLSSVIASIRVFFFQRSQFFASGFQSIGASASASVLPMNIQGWFSLGLTDLISLQQRNPPSPARDSWVFSSITIRKHYISGNFFMVQISHLYMTTEKKT